MRDLIVAQATAAPLTGRPRTFRQAAKAWLDEPHARAHSWTLEPYAFNRGLLAEPGDDERRGRILLNEVLRKVELAAPERDCGERATGDRVRLVPVDEPARLLVTRGPLSQ